MADIKLGVFATENIQKASLSLLSDLGIDMNVRSEKPISIENLIKGVLGQVPKAVQEICAKIKESYLVGIISDKIFSNEEEESFDDAIKSAEQGKYNQMMVFAVDFEEDAHVTRTEMAALTRALNRASKACPVVLACRYNDDIRRFALSLCERTAYVQGGHTGEKAGKVNILRGINPSKPHTGHIRIIEDMRLASKDKTFDAVYAKWFGIFDNEVLTNKFYQELQNWFFWALKPESGVSFPNDISTDEDDQKYNPQNVIRLITRLIFVWFLKQKGLVPKELFDREELDKIVKNFEPDNFQSSSYYRVILQNLFFATLNKKIEEREFVSDSFYENRNKGKHKIKTYMRHACDLKISKEAFIDLMRPVPFMNNSIFECLDDKEQNGRKYRWDGFSEKKDDDQKQACVPNYLFFAKEEFVDLSKEYGRQTASSIKVFGLLNILSRYNFTVEENTPLDQDVALDPELLGKVFENLLAAYNPETRETVRKSTGSYYTPRPIVQYMVDESLIAHLKKEVPEVEESKIRALLSYDDNIQEDTLDNELKKKIAKAILNCKVLDPACGSGAFPMGILQQMNHLLRRVDADNTYWEQLVVDRAVNDKSFVEKMNDEEIEARKKEVENVFRLSINYPDYARKLYLIENCIYGVDIQSIAVQISRLRFFISLLCEQQPSKDASNNYDIKPLPNLEMKFVCANTLVRLEHINEARELFANKEVLDLIDELKGVRHELFVVTDHHLKEKLLVEDSNLRAQIALSTGECFEKSVKEDIRKHEETVERKERELEIILSKPVDIQKIEEVNLFGETKVTTINKTEKQIRDLKSDISYFKKKAEDLKKSISEGRDKAVKLAKQLTEWNPYDQNLSSPFFDPEWMFGVKDGFNIVIGNPPYVNISNIKDDAYRNLLKNTFRCNRNKTDLYAFFTEQGFILLKQGGVLAFIIPETWKATDSFSLLRKIIIENKILQIVNLRMGVFDAIVRPLIALFEKNKENNDYSFKVMDNLRDYKYDIHISEVTSTSDLRIDTESSVIEKKLFKQIEKTNKTLGDILKFSRGIKTSNDSRFVLTEKQNEDCKPVFRGKNIKDFQVKWQGEWIWYRPDLMREKVGCLPHTKDFFEVPEKIVTQRVNSSMQLLATYDDKQRYYLDTVNVSDYSSWDKKYSLRYICGLLNSKVINFWYSHKYRMPTIGGYELESIPIVTPQRKDQEEIDYIVTKILKLRDEEKDWSIENELLNKKVFFLYGLTYDEVKVIDPETPISREEYEKFGKE